MCHTSDFLTLMNKVNEQFDPFVGIYEDLHPMLLAAKANDINTPNYHQAMNGSNSSGYMDAMDLEFSTLDNKMSAWDIVDRTKDMKVLGSIWAFRCKLFPDGMVRKLKARFCVRGDQQVEGIDFFETFAPVVSWTTVRLLLILSVHLNLASMQVDYTSAFLHATIDDTVFVDMPRGFKQPGKVLKLKRSLYGLRQSPRNFFLHLKGKLEDQEFKQSTADPCLFIRNDMICLVYVDDCLFFAPDDCKFDNLLQKLREADLTLEKEDDVAGFLGVKLTVDKHAGTVELTQTGLIDRIIEAMHLEDSSPKNTPAEYATLPKDEHGEDCNSDFNYASIVGMLLYLLGHSRPELAFSVSQCARYTFHPKMSHEIALKRIGRYLQGTRTKGMIMKPTNDLNLDCYVDSDFAGLWSFEDDQDPTCVKSRTGFIMLLGGCPLMWSSKLQTEIALSTMEAEYIALSTALRDLIPLKRLVKVVTTAVGLNDSDTTIKTTVWEDNQGCVILANLEPPRMTPRSKHYAIKYHWFRTQLKSNNISIAPIDSADQNADFLTKGLRHTLFAANRFRVMGW